MNSKYETIDYHYYKYLAYIQAVDCIEDYIRFRLPFFNVEYVPDTSNRKYSGLGKDWILKLYRFGDNNFIPLELKFKLSLKSLRSTFFSTYRPNKVEFLKNSFNSLSFEEAYISCNVSMINNI